jgi:menaquinone-dependent protoporphyrinogen oxidase
MDQMTRRAFMLKGSLMAGATVGGLAWAGELLSPPKARGAAVEFPQSSCESKKPVNRKFLIAYASFCGTTGGVAEALGQVLCERGAQVDVRLVKNVQELSSYDAVVLGSPVQRASWLPEAVEFVEKNQAALNRMPVAYFLTCLALYRDTAETRGLARSYFNPVLKAVPAVQPVDLGLFAGALDYSKLNVIQRMIMKSRMKEKGVPEGDFRDWKAIRAWAAGLHPSTLKPGSGQSFSRLRSPLTPGR